MDVNGYCWVATDYIEENGRLYVVHILYMIKDGELYSRELKRKEVAYG
jgi:hypothetical protein